MGFRLFFRKLKPPILVKPSERTIDSLLDNHIIESWYFDCQDDIYVFITKHPFKVKEIKNCYVHNLKQTYAEIYGKYNVVIQPFDDTLIDVKDYYKYITNKLAE